MNMGKKRYILIIAFLFAFCQLLTVRADYIRDYTEEHPLVIIMDWEFPPYEYRNDKGEADGYNVEVLDLVLNKLGIPHEFHMKEWYKCTEAFERREADLIHALSFLYDGDPYTMTQNMITYYNVRIARLDTTPPLKRLSQLTENDTIIVKKNDYADIRVNENNPVYKIVYRATREALIGIASGKYKYYVWGEMPVSMKIKELDLEHIVLDEADIPSGELRIIGYDKELINDIDDTFARLEQSGDIDKIRDKWFHPERIHNDTSPIALLIIIGFVIAGIIIFLLSLLIRSRIKTAYNKSIDLNRIMTQALNMGAFAVIKYDVDGNLLSNLHGHILPDEGMLPQEFIRRMKPDKGKLLHENNQRLIKGEADTFNMTMSLDLGTEEKPDVKEYYGNALTEKENGRTKFIIYTVKDLTQDILEERFNRETGHKYQLMFKTNLMAMSFYSKDGTLIDLNEKMKQLCEFDDEGEIFFRQLNLFDIPLNKGQLQPDFDENYHVCQHMFYPEIGLSKYIEFKIHPTFNDNHELCYYIATARDVTPERNIYLNRRKHDEEIQKTNETINFYESQLKYLLEKSNMYVWTLDLKDRSIRFARSLRDINFSMSRDEYIAGMAEDEREEADSNLVETMMQGKPFNAVHHFNYTPISPEPCWYALSGVPTLNKEGKLTSYFGIARNITDLMVAQQKLKEETERAEDSGKMKSAFLANMTHEIRTPLNAIVGFSDLLPMVETKEERMEFIRIIRNNCDMLMRLINDILEASNMGQALSIKPAETDFAIAFEDICQTLAQRVQEPGVEFIKDNPYDTFPAFLDKGRIQQVLTNFTTNAVKYTHQGHIKVGYREQDGGIYLYCEDTGAGIPKEKQAAVFERFVKLDDFVQGTGLGLSICKAIAERCGGKIGVTSEGEGHGSTFWLWIPQ